VALEAGAAAALAEAAGEDGVATLADAAGLALAAADVDAGAAVLGLGAALEGEAAAGLELGAAVPPQAASSTPTALVEANRRKWRRLIVKVGPPGW
jgi:hypothetical protein